MVLLLILFIGAQVFIAYWYIWKKMFDFGNIFRFDNPIIHKSEHNYFYIIENNSFHTVLERIRISINQYIKRNPNSVDSRIIETIIENENDAKENSITQLISIPLYIGLVGTMMGIVLGIASIDFGSEGSIEPLLNKVMLAMIVSGVGVGLTMLSNVIFEKQKTKNYEGKRKFYQFLQTNLYPYLSGIEPLVLTLKNELTSFNEVFGKNIKDFGRSMDSLQNNYQSQKELLQKIDELDLTELTQANLSIFENLNKNIRTIENFNTHLVETSKLLKNNLYDSTKTFENFNVNLNKLLFSFNALFTDMDKVKDDLPDAIGKVKEVFEREMNNLIASVKTSIELYRTEMDKNTGFVQNAHNKHIEKLNEEFQKLLNRMIQNMEAIEKQYGNINALVIEKFEKESDEVPKRVGDMADAWKNAIDTLNAEIESSIGSIRNTLTNNDIDLGTFFENIVTKSEIKELSEAINKNTSEVKKALMENKGRKSPKNNKNDDVTGKSPEGKNEMPKGKEGVLDDRTEKKQTNKKFEKSKEKNREKISDLAKNTKSEKIKLKDVRISFKDLLSIFKGK